MLIPKSMESSEADQEISDDRGGGQSGGLPHFFYEDLARVVAASGGAECVLVLLTGETVCRGNFSEEQGCST